MKAPLKSKIPAARGREEKTGEIRFWNQNMEWFIDQAKWAGDLWKMKDLKGWFDLPPEVLLTKFESTIKSAGPKFSRSPLIILGDPVGTLEFYLFFAGIREDLLELSQARGQSKFRKAFHFAFPGTLDWAFRALRRFKEKRHAIKHSLSMRTLLDYVGPYETQEELRRRCIDGPFSSSNWLNKRGRNRIRLSSSIYENFQLTLRHVDIARVRQCSFCKEAYWLVRADKKTCSECRVKKWRKRNPQKAKKIQARAERKRKKKRKEQKEEKLKRGGQLVVPIEQSKFQVRPDAIRPGGRKPYRKKKRKE
ncbi:MAG: hypothetical protein LAO21_17800 [Acidobacteriia bacterium]|nr:hypothetical protein [Terriglobia bacterium]